VYLCKKLIMELTATIGWILLMVLMLGTLVYIIINTVKSERKRKLFEPDMSVGDAVYFPVAEGSLAGEILEVNKDSVKIVVTITRSRVYPK
jgi:preprotein translocase subunit YajC